MKKIGISLRVENIKKYNEKRDAISQDWIKFCNNIGFFPILIPNNLTNTKKFLKTLEVDMMIFSGGDNVGEDPGRDKTEKNMLEFAIKHKIPSLGVCRGMQFFNKFFGGKIKQKNDNSHVKTRHNVKISDHKIEKVLKKRSLSVNSFHNNFLELKTLGKDIIPFGMVEFDDTVEAFYHKKFPIIGVMWHPERESNFQKEYKLIKILEDKKIWK